MSGQSSVFVAFFLVLAVLATVTPGNCEIQLYQDNAAHPRLLCSASELEEVRSRLDQPVESAAFERLLVKCNAYLDPKSDEYVDWQEREKAYWTSRPGAWRLTKFIQELAWVGLLSGEERYINGAKNIVFTIIRERVIDDVGGEWHGKEYEGWKSNTVDTCDSGMPLGIFYDLLYDHMTEEERAEVRNYLLNEYILFLYKNQMQVVKNDRYPGIMGSNGRFAASYTGVVLTLALYGETEHGTKEELEWLRLFLTGIRGYVLFGIGQDGGMLEGPGYGAYVLNMMGCAADMLKRAGAEKLGEDPPLWEDPRLRKGARYFLHEVRPNGDHYNNTNDSSFGGHSEFLLLYASRLQDPALTWLWEHVDGRPTDEGIFGDSYNYGGTWACVLPYVILWHGQAPEPKSPDELGVDRDQLFSRRGQVSMRTNWREDGCLFSFLCGGHSEDLWSHTQYDGNHFAIYCGESVLAADAGYGGRETAVHNSLLFDGEGQSGRCPEGRIVAYKPGNIASYACGSAGPLYQNQKLETFNRHVYAGPLYQNEALETFNRHVYFVRGSHGPVVAVWDELAADGNEHTYTWLLNILEGMEFDLSGDHPVVVDTANEWLMDVFLLASTAPKFTLLSAEHSRAGGSRHYSHPCLAAEVKTETSPSFLALLYPHKPGAELPQVTRVNEHALRVNWGDYVDLIAFGPAQTSEASTQDIGFVRTETRGR